jgi:hypothetical protein
VGVLLFFLLRGNGNSSTTASATTTTSASAGTTSSSPPTMSGGSGMGSGHLPGGASNPPSNPGGTMNTGSSSSGGTCHYSGCDQVAAAWLSAMLKGDYNGAFALSCTQLQDAATRGSQGSNYSPAEYLAVYFYGKTLGGQGFTDGTLTDASFDSTTGYDLVRAELTLEDGSTKPVTVAVDSNQSVCDFG